MTKHPRVEKFLAENPFGPDHAAHGFDLSDPIVPALEYFLTLDAVPGHEKKLQQIKSEPVRTLCKNDCLIQWASLCAEIGALCLLGKTLGVEIVGFEQVSPRSANSEKDCDIVAVVNGEEKYFEVKRNAAEDKQTLPKLLEQRLIEFQQEVPFGMTPELVDRNYKCTGLDEKLRRLRDHVRVFGQGKEQGLTDRCKPPIFRDDAFTVMFHRDETLAYCGRRFFSPIGPKEAAKKLLGPGGTERKGKPMTPFVQKAAEKRAHYLICRVPRWGRSWSDIVGEIFEASSHQRGVTYFSNDPRLDRLEGVILFASYDDFCIINNLRASTRNWLTA